MIALSIISLNIVQNNLKFKENDERNLENAFQTIKFKDIERNKQSSNIISNENSYNIASNALFQQPNTKETKKIKFPFHITKQSEWYNFFPGHARRQIYHIAGPSPSAVCTENYNYIVYTHIINTRTTGSGGGILISYDNSLVLIESTTIINCYADNSAGAIYAKNVEEMILNKVCGSTCGSTAECSFMFAYLYWKDTSFDNFVLSSSIYNSYGNLGYTVDHQYGHVVHSLTNYSYNTGDYGSVIFEEPSPGGTRQSSFITYTTFTNNTSTGHGIIMLYKNVPAAYEFDSCNIVYNIQTNIVYALIYMTGYTTIKNTCITNNNCPVVFQTTNAEAVLINCTVSPEHLGNTYGAINTANIGPFYSQFFNYFTYPQQDMCHISPKKTEDSRFYFQSFRKYSFL